MKFILTFQLNKPVIPLEYRRIILSFIKSALTKCNAGKYYEDYYKDSRQKNFTWYAIFQKPKFLKDTIELQNNQFDIVFSAENVNQSAYILYMALNGMKNIQYPLENGNQMRLLHIQQKTVHNILGSCCLFKTSIGSPCVVREHNHETNEDKYYSVSDQNYNLKLTECLQRQIVNDGFSEKDCNMISAHMVRGKKVVVRHYGQLLDTSAGILEIKAPNYILDHLNQVGICSRRSAGFGSIELIAEKE